MTTDNEPGLEPDEERPGGWEPTEDEIADGNHMGTVIDSDDDEDNGLGGAA